jgi:hypothetical protein
MSRAWADAFSSSRLTAQYFLCINERLCHAKGVAVKLIKMLASATVAAAAVAVFAGATSASAAPIDTCLYSSGTPALNAAGCTFFGTKHSESTKVTFLAEAKNPILQSETLEEKCEKSHTTIDTKGDGTPGLQMTALSFTGGCSPCPTVDTTPPYAGTLVMEGENYFLKMSSNITLLNCFGFVNCKFTSEAVTLKYVPSATHLHNEFRAEAEKLTGPGGVCGTTGKWTANYVVSTPLRFFFFLL